MGEPDTGRSFPLGSVATSVLARCKTPLLLVR